MFMFICTLKTSTTKAPTVPEIRKKLSTSQPRSQKRGAYKKKACTFTNPAWWAVDRALHAGKELDYIQYIHEL